MCRNGAREPKTMMQKTQGTSDSLIPRSGLHAAELEDNELGVLFVSGNEMLFKCHKSCHISAKWVWASNLEANMQMRFYRDTHQETKERRAAFFLVRGGKK
jgi:hypothetical protein